MGARTARKLKRRQRTTGNEIPEPEVLPYAEIDGKPVNFDELEPNSITYNIFMEHTVANLPGFRKLYPHMTDECFAAVAKGIASHCAPRYSTTYEWDLVHHVVPELITRLGWKFDSSGKPIPTITANPSKEGDVPFVERY